MIDNRVRERERERDITLRTMRVVKPVIYREIMGVTLV